jgi:hypothetical protein
MIRDIYSKDDTCVKKKWMLIELQVLQSRDPQKENIQQAHKKLT